MANENRVPLSKLQHIFTLILLLTNLATAYFLFFNKEVKRIDFTCVSDFAIADLNEKPHKDLKLSFQEQPITNASLVTILCKNSGNQDLFPVGKEKSDEHLNPRINIEFNKEAKILSANLKSKDLSTKLTALPQTKTNSIGYAIDLLNEEAEFQIDLIISGYYEEDGYKPEASGLGMKHRTLEKGAYSKTLLIGTVIISGLIGLLLSVITQFLLNRKLKKLKHNLSKIF